MLMWSKTEQEGVAVFTSDIVDGYEILEINGPQGTAYFVRCTSIDCEDIGPLCEFKQAEDIILKINIALVAFEEQNWLLHAALALKNTQAEFKFEGDSKHETLA